MLELANLVPYVALTTLLVLMLYNLYIFSELPLILKIFSYYIIHQTTFQLTTYLLSIYSINNLFLIPVYSITGMAILSFFYKKIFEGFINDRIIYIVLISFIVTVAINIFYFGQTNSLGDLSLTINSIIIIVYSSFTFIILLNDMVREKRTLVLKSLNWINSGLFIYFTSSLLFFYFGTYITSSTPSTITRYTWMLHALFSLVMYICFFLGLWNRPPKSSS